MNSRILGYFFKKQNCSDDLLKDRSGKREGEGLLVSRESLESLAKWLSAGRLRKVRVYHSSPPWIRSTPEMFLMVGKSGFGMSRFWEFVEPDSLATQPDTPLEPWVQKQVLGTISLLHN